MSEKYKLNKEKFESRDSKITGREVLINGGLEPIEDYELLLKINEGGFEPVQLDEVIDLKSPGIEGFFAKPYKKLLILVDKKEIEIEECFMSPTEILNKASINAENYFLKQLKGDIEIGYENDPNHKIAIKNKSTFISCKIDKNTIIIVNGKPKVWDKLKISFKDVVILAYGNYIDRPTMVYTVGYEDGPKENIEGSMIKNSEVFVTNNMIFHATATDKS